jgi:hypothetical protein
VPLLRVNGTDGRGRTLMQLLEDQGGKLLIPPDDWKVVPAGAASSRAASWEPPWFSITVLIPGLGTVRVSISTMEGKVSVTRVETGTGVRLLLLPRNQMYWHYLNTGGHSD